MKRRKKAAKRKRARKPAAKPWTVTLRLTARDAKGFRALARGAGLTPRKLLHAMAVRAVTEFRALPITVAPAWMDKDLAAAVRKAGHAADVVRFHSDRAFIASIYEHMRKRGLLGGMTLDQFKQRLIELHRARLLRLTRADLVGRMPRAEVDRSEARYLDATFHFVALD